MSKFAQRGIAALVVGVLTASCSGHAGGPVLPQSATGAQHNIAGTGTTRKASTTSAVPSGWASTATQAMSLSGVTDLGALAGSTPLTVRVGLQTRNVQQLNQLIASNQTIDNATYMAQYAPTSDQVTSVVSYLQSAGFTNVKADPDNVLVSADGTAEIARKAFNTSLESYSVSGQSVFANTTAALVPQSLGGIAIAVLGLNSIAHVVQPQCVQGAVGLPCLGSLPTAGLSASFNASQIQKVYDVGTTPDASQTTIGLMMWGDVSGAVSDLRLAEQKQNLPQVPAQIVVSGLVTLNGGGGGFGEWDLDTQASTGIAQNVKKLYVYTTTGPTDSDITLMYNRWANDNLAQVASSSFGECEVYPYVDGSMVLNDEILAFAASHGQTMFASSGDTGSQCPANGIGVNGVPAGVTQVGWPASSPYVVGVGGTELLPKSDGTYDSEKSWVSGGGGLSAFEYQPYWENGVQPASNGTTSSLGLARGVPDIAMISTSVDQLGGYVMYYPGGPGAVGGTSLSSPLAAGAYARLMSAHNNSLGYAPPRFYALYNQNPTAGAQSGTFPTQPRGGFHDVLTGTNGAYTALPGYDYTTGLGSLDITAINALIGH